MHSLSPSRCPSRPESRPRRKVQSLSILPGTNHDCLATAAAAAAHAKRFGPAYGARGPQSMPVRPVGGMPMHGASSDGDAGSAGASAVRTAGEPGGAAWATTRATDATTSPASSGAERADAARAKGCTDMAELNAAARLRDFRRANSDCQDHTNIQCRIAPMRQTQKRALRRW